MKAYPPIFRRKRAPSIFFAFIPILIMSHLFRVLSWRTDLFLFSLAVQNLNECQRPLGLGGDAESIKGLLLLLHHYQSINNTCFRSSCLRLVPRWSIRATWHRHEGGARLAAACEWGAEQLQQSLTITVSGWGNGTVGRREARMMLSSSWYHQLKLVMTEVTKQHSVCSKMKLYLYWVNADCYWLFLGK